MQTTGEAKAYCRLVGKGIEKMVADGGAPLELRGQTSFTVCKL